MQTHKAKRVVITIEAIMQKRLTDALESAGVTGYSILDVIGGSGRSGPWTSEGQISRASGMVQVICIIREERLDTLMEAAFDVVEKHIGVVTIGDVEVVRAERF
ncbi:transcriptional regulator [Ponticoccus sp. SC2-23]|uniref:P-II family nitrogen regulator n=1 Tax=Alexandriicola marinus TaxID=2081710 RepID=UPI000FD903F2|nr:transcriptional regulator [Alexandriicola marinus]MBM1221861.1 transcriptional regulator [Ponticoccus sp. SC6-9]MBM1226212.1 transcriptional regulator [Ponticoccus sp. SC6-15]MBM1230808.1 transcriptional regulator [Ponticoccus sp. SC6-38]MBM1235351.1 transcriptional regulator [Ponticoccus sp. SC6-45]MBM1239830.1 transcriptional regulator [Ponticoccus sp. SC6-49]MBM1243974.1 transcriptional regulator [Ponticoccus sp. SC2-64]MBM1248875.1 transcriptional regulator [Ponticoccus sp. SC6-42]MB